MKILVLAISLSYAASAQVTLTATANPSTVRAGQSTTVTISATGTPNVAALQWNLSLPSGWTFAPAQATSATTAASKTVQCGSVLCLLWGQDVSLVPSGALATMQVTVPFSATPGTAQINVAAAAALGATPFGTPTPVLVGPAATITVQASLFDVTGDGKITVADMTTVAGWVAAGSCATDLDGDSRCTIADLMLEVIAWNAAGKLP